MCTFSFLFVGALYITEAGRDEAMKGWQGVEGVRFASLNDQWGVK